MILTDSDILEGMKAKNIEIEPFNKDRLGSNSYDLTLGKTLMLYKPNERGYLILDSALENPMVLQEIPDDGFTLMPNTLYLGSTVERTRTRIHVPVIEGKSSVGRLGISIHITAGFGDIGFSGHWTLEITVIHPVHIYAGMPIAQIYYMMALGRCITPYGMKKDAKYNQQGALPAPSQMHKNFKQLNTIS